MIPQRNLYQYLPKGEPKKFDVFLDTDLPLSKMKDENLEMVLNNLTYRYYYRSFLDFFKIIFLIYNIVTFMTFIHGIVHLPFKKNLPVF